MWRPVVVLRGVRGMSQNYHTMILNNLPYLRFMSSISHQKT